MYALVVNGHSIVLLQLVLDNELNAGLHDLKFSVLSFSFQSHTSVVLMVLECPTASDPTPSGNPTPFDDPTPSGGPTPSGDPSLSHGPTSSSEPTNIQLQPNPSYCSVEMSHQQLMSSRLENESKYVNL